MKTILFIVTSILLFFSFCEIGHADSLYQAPTGLEDMDFTEVEDILNEIGYSEELSFEELVSGLMSGDTKITQEVLIDWVRRALLSEFQDNRQMIIAILGIGIMAAIFYNLSMAFANQQAAEISFFIAYISFLVITITAFLKISDVAVVLLRRFELVMQALIPAFFLAVTASTGSYTAIGFYQVTLIVLTFLGKILLSLVIPMIKAMIVLALMNYITKEEILTRMIAFMKSICKWILKSVLAAVIGMNALQGVVLPSLDGLNTSMIKKAISIIPGIGSSAEAVTTIVTNSSALLKNAIGAAGCIVIVLLGVIPLVQVGVFSFIYQILGAVLQPVSDKRIIDALSMVADGGKLIFQTMATALVLIILTIAIVCVVTR